MCTDVSPKEQLISIGVVVRKFSADKIGLRFPLHALLECNDLQICLIYPTLGESESHRAQFRLIPLISIYLR